MALISNAKVKNSTGNYERLLGNKELGRLISKVQSTIISNGTELERTINSLLKEQGNLIEDIDTFLDSSNIKMGTYLISKKSLKESKKIDFSGQEPDFVVLKINPQVKHCSIIELKDGHVFDTKKVEGEKESLKKFEKHIATKIPYTTSIHICAFNQENKKEIIVGLKSKFSESEILTGEEFCNILNLNYDNIKNNRKKDAEENFKYFLTELMKIKEIKDFYKTFF